MTYRPVNGTKVTASFSCDGSIVFSMDELIGRGDP